MVIDTHTHLFCEEFDEDRAQVVARAKETGVDKLLMPNIDLSTLEPLLGMCCDYPGYCLPMIGLHPTSVAADFRTELQALKQELDKNPHTFIAIGEVGLDLYWDDTFLQEQLEAFNEQIRWALEYDLPLVIHCRKAFDQLLDCLEPYRKTPLRGVFHSFTGDDGDINRILSFHNFLLGINGVITFKKSVLPTLLPERIPLERLVVETDSPYLAPVPHRGRRNESAYVVDVLQKLADVYSIPMAQAGQITSQNAVKLFRLKA